MERMHKTAFAVAAALSFGSQAFAQDESAAPKSAYVGLLGTYLDLDQDRGADDGTGIAAYFGRQLGHGNWFWEGQLYSEVFETDAGSFTDFYRYGAGLDLVYALNQRQGWSPFLLLGVSGAYNDVIPDDQDGWDVVGNAGIGLATRPFGTYGIRVRGEARYVYDNFEDGYGDIRYGLGLEIPLTPYERPAAEPAPVPEPATVVKVEDMADSDGDGVPDSFDKCPGTPQGMPVDGVGCGLSQVITLTGVNFEFDKASLTPDARKILEEVSLKIKHFNEVPMELAGHTDSKGSDAYNQKLSQLRADSVRTFLIEQGVPGDRLTAKGYGESQPVADNNTDAGRELNRRVELHIAGQEAPPSVPVDASGAPTGEAPAEATPPAEAAAPAAEEPAPSEAAPAEAEAAPAEEPAPAAEPEPEPEVEDSFSADQLPPPAADQPQPVQ